jgi:ABC-type multidrug transport system ATPase subunit
MLTGEESPSSGKAQFFHKNITHCTSNLSSNVGYCPQFDALDRQLTGDELLRCYARLKGITGAAANRVSGLSVVIGYLLLLRSLID